MSSVVIAPSVEIEHAYGVSAPYTVGVEEEFALIDPETGDLIPRAHELMEAAEARADVRNGRITHELMQSVIEASTGVCAGPTEALEQLRVLRLELADLARQTGCQIASAGTHPFAQYDLQQVTDKPRYRELIERLQWVARRELIFGLHVHVGVDSPDKAVYVMDGLRSWLPELLALSVNSPFWQGARTGLMSSRVNVFQSFPRSGVPEVFGTWANWRRLIERAQSAGVIADHTYLWWDVRLHPAFGTVEVRILDAQTEVEATAALTALVQACAATLGHWFDEGVRLDHPPNMLVEENKWRAARYGMDAEFVPLVGDGAPRPAREMVAELLEIVTPAAADLGTAELLGGIEQLAQRTGAERQLAVYERTGDLADVVDALVADTLR